MDAGLGPDTRLWEAAKRDDLAILASLLDGGTPADPVPPIRPTRKEQFRAFAADYGFVQVSLCFGLVLCRCLCLCLSVSVSVSVCVSVCLPLSRSRAVWALCLSDTEVWAG